MSDVHSARKRDRTRDKLLVAAQQLLLERPAASLSIRDVTTRAEVVHATFYNYFDSVPALLHSVGLLFYAAHSQLLQGLTRDCSDPADIFALSTRQTLRFITRTPDYGHLLFDAGLPIDQYLAGLRLALQRDVALGVHTGSFHVHDLELTVSLITGSLLGLALDLHRQTLPVTAIEDGTAHLLQMLGLSGHDARRIAHQPATFLTPPALPLSWIALNKAQQQVSA